MAIDDLRTTLMGLPELTLIGTTLLSEDASGGLFPVGVPRESLREAVQEVVAYTENCQATARRLRNLAPIPLSVSPPEYVL